MLRSQRLRFALTAFAVWCVSSLLLRYAYPVYFDGAGPLPSFFYTGHLPGLAEYYRHRWLYELRFFVPYGVTSLVLTFTCLFVAPKVTHRLTRHRNIAAYSTIFFVLIFAAAAASDVVNIVWLHRGLFYSGLGSLIRLLTVAVPLAVGSALLAVAAGKRRATNQIS